MGSMEKLLSAIFVAFCFGFASNVFAAESKGEINRFWVYTSGATNFVLVSLIDPANTSENMRTNPDACPQAGYFSLESNSPFYDTAISTFLTAKAMKVVVGLNVTGCSSNGYPSFNNIDFQ